MAESKMRNFYFSFLLLPLLPLFVVVVLLVEPLLLPVGFFVFFGGGPLSFVGLGVFCGPGGTC